MLARGQLSVALALALAACARARPDAATRSSFPINYPPIENGIRSVNAVQHLPEPEVKPVQPLRNPVDTPEQSLSLSPFAEQNFVATADSPVPPVTVTATEAKAYQGPVPELFRDNLKPVNKRYPHAVLFGGTCGGTIIHPRWVLTAGHCTLFTGGRYVLAGTNTSDDNSGVTKKVKKLHVHPLFSVGPYWLNAKTFGIKQVAARWDFMLAELEEPLELDGVTIAAAPLGREDAPTLPPDSYVGYAGYGTDHHGGFMRTEMHAMHLRTQTDKQCSVLEQYEKDDMLCAKGYAPNFDSACNGDSGSGLVDGDGKLVGVASWVQNDAFECAAGNIVVFSRVASVRKWIDEKISAQIPA